MGIMDNEGHDPIGFGNVRPARSQRHVWQLEHYMRNAAASLDVLIIEVLAHGCTTQAARLRSIASDLRQRADHLKAFDDEQAGDGNG